MAEEDVEAELSFAARPTEKAFDASTVHDSTDPGDETQRNFRYQYLYGVIILVAAKAGSIQYDFIWCEHFEDFLCQRPDDKFDGFQIKTQRPENGPWKVTDEGFVKSVGRFVDRDRQLQGKLDRLYFVSNTEFDTVTAASRDERRRGRCPGLFLAHIKQCRSAADVAPPFLPTFESLQAQCGCEAAPLFDVLKRVDLIVGPPRSACETVVSNEHIATLPRWKDAPRQVVDKYRDDLVAQIFRASSLQVEDPARHIRGLINPDGADPSLIAKRIAVSDVLNFTEPQQAFRFHGTDVMQLGAPRPSKILELKLEKGGLSHHLEYMSVRERSAEFALLEDAIRRPDLYPDLQFQIEQVVLGACTEAYVKTRMDDRAFGEVMLADVQQRLAIAARDRSPLIGGHDYECLMGMTGLLTSGCRVWWSLRFDVMETAA